ncbi:hypothetical protein LSTR_LSTR003158 [Laodelphax striatellus]|uniref:Phospholipase A-2-activating protein n=1 Tax=Laodelphax striatellus TaxID=195883 RepID=A0A482WVR7_LAOST|nr:hypothetical protein LSTR_LSTR003158 [Laodelphax striatellus]
MPFKLSAALYGHSLDVRALAVTSDGRIVSASRDKTAKVWKPNLHNAGFCEDQTLKGHSKFVSSVCVLPASEILPGGLILTGSNDNTICAYRTGDTEPAFVLTGHTNAVCCLSASTNPKTPSIVLSSSWDQTAKVWCLGGGGGGGEALLTLTGHQAAVWSVVQLSGGHIVTASADKTIRTYTAEGKHEVTITGHTDCVRDLAALQSPTEFLSCANDATIRKWNVITGECLDTWYGHPHYIYSISALPSGLVVSGGEDRSVFVWNSGGKQESITLPAQSVWAVALLPNGDVVTGSSDGVVRVFSCNENRQADEVTLAQFEEEIAALTRAASQEVGGVKVSELPGKEALLAAGKSDGQTKMVQEDGVATVYSWSAEQQQWVKVGTAMGAVGPDNPETGRTTFNGKEYDYVFSVDIEDGKPPLKLPYNNGEDPWHAAQNFIHRNNLNQQFLEQIANFIITNSKKPEPVVLNQAAAAANVGYCDPFTGGARYIPEGVSSAPAPQQPLSNGSTSNRNDSGPTLFPQTKSQLFDAGNLELIKDKLLEFNKDPTRSVDNESLASLLKLAETDIEPTNAALDTLQKLLEWPDNFLLPVLDVLRMCLRNSRPNSALVTSQRCNHVFGVLTRQLSGGGGSTNRALALRCVVNMMCHGGGEEAVSERRQQLLPMVEACVEGLATGAAAEKSSHLQIALSTSLLNFAILAIKQTDSSTQTQLVRLLQALLPLLTNAEAQLRALVAIGTLLAASDQLINSCLDPVTLDLLMGLSVKDGDSGQVGKVALCSRQIVERFAWK